MIEDKNSLLRYISNVMAKSDALFLLFLGALNALNSFAR